MNRTHIFFNNNKPGIVIKTKINTITSNELAKGRSKGILPKNTINISKIYHKYK